MIILTTALYYKAEVVKPFLNSLFASGFSGQIAAISNKCGAREYLESQGVEILDDIDNGYPINSRRFLVYREFLRGVSEPVIICDVRDIIFQSNPEENMPVDGINVFREYEGITIGECPYNSKWMKAIFGKVKWGDKEIICAGATSGRLTEYCDAVWQMLSNLPPTVGLDQAVHNHLIYSERIKANVVLNEAGQVYTVGYMPRESVSLAGDGFIRNKAGEIPCMIHQYDRHQNLTKMVKEKYGG